MQATWFESIWSMVGLEKTYHGMVSWSMMTVIWKYVNPIPQGRERLLVWFDVVAVCKQAGMESAFMLLHILTFESKPKFFVGLSMGPISSFEGRWKRWGVAGGPPCHVSVQENSWSANLEKVQPLLQCQECTSSWQVGLVQLFPFLFFCLYFYFFLNGREG